MPLEEMLMIGFSAVMGIAICSSVVTLATKEK